MKGNNLPPILLFVLATATTAFAVPPSQQDDWQKVKSLMVEFQEGNQPPSSDGNLPWHRAVGTSTSNPGENRLTLERRVALGSEILESGRFTWTLEGLEIPSDHLYSVRIEPIDLVSSAPISISLAFKRRAGSDAKIRSWAQDTRAIRKFRVGLLNRANRESRSYEFRNCKPTTYSSIDVSTHSHQALDSLQLACGIIEVGEYKARKTDGENLFLKWLSDAPRNFPGKKNTSQRSITIKEIGLDGSIARTVKYNGVKLLKYRAPELVTDSHNELTESTDLISDTVVFP